VPCFFPPLSLYSWYCCSHENGEFQCTFRFSDAVRIQICTAAPLVLFCVYPFLTELMLQGSTVGLHVYFSLKLTAVVLCFVTFAWWETLLSHARYILYVCHVVLDFEFCLRCSYADGMWVDAISMSSLNSSSRDCRCSSSPWAVFLFECSFVSSFFGCFPGRVRQKALCSVYFHFVFSNRYPVYNTPLFYLHSAYSVC
jgi:hypothetical protein